MHHRLHRAGVNAAGAFGLIPVGLAARVRRVHPTRVHREKGRLPAPLATAGGNALEAAPQVGSRWGYQKERERRMLRVTIELLPGGRESGKSVIATADIARVSDAPFGARADYGVVLKDAVLGEIGGRAVVRSYPRWATSVWDLVARGIAAALNQDTESLPPRPVKPEVTVHTNEAGFRYVRLDEIPEPTRTFFDRKLAGSGIPDHGCAYAHDWFDFLNGQR
ncbi:hypothetical protein [Paraburkholderia oxyphila]|uniref:hypothetical protein n=1 Tax=Paraburkholderia oxyphila TaxID=614212 RepID=UPI001FE0932C|nr:hypothetical protein [Paraburkholderia oxyphila]